MTNPAPPPLRRSLLFVPGDSTAKIGKATSLAADSVILDLEDGVAPNRKEVARQSVGEALATLDFGRRERLVRINAGNTPLAQEDLRQTIAARPDGYVLPKVASAGTVEEVAHFLDGAEAAHGWPRQSVRLLALIETALGVLNLAEIARSSPRLDALLFGAEDLAGDLGAVRTPGGWEVFYARSAVVTAAAAYGLAAVDTVFVDLTDLVGLEAEARFARQIGFSGKMAIHPRQLETIHRAFTPSAPEISMARRLIQAFEAHAGAGIGVFELDGKMVDMPIVRAAQRLLARADHPANSARS